MDWKRAHLNTQTVKPQGACLFAIRELSGKSKLYLFGGLNTSFQQTNQLLCLEEEPLKPTSRRRSGSVRIGFEPGVISMKKTSPDPRERCTIVSFGVNRAVLFGGLQTIERPKRFNDTWILYYESKLYSWTRAKSTFIINTPVERYDHNMIAFDKICILFGGFNGKSSLDDTWVMALNDETVEWKCIKAKHSPAPRYQHAACGSEKRMYIYGGRNRNDCFNDLWCFNLENDSWSEIWVQNPPIPRYGLCMYYLNHNLVSFGGRCSNGTHNDELYMLDFKKQHWYSIGVMNQQNEQTRDLSPPGLVGFSSCLVVSDILSIAVCGGLLATDRLSVNEYLYRLDTFFLDFSKTPKSGNYELLEYIGTGPYSNVFKVRDTKVYVLKRIISNGNALKEYDFIRNSSHRHLQTCLTSILEKKDHDTFVNVVSPYCKYGDLYQFCKSVGSKTPLTEIEILDLFIQIVSGLNHLHNTLKCVHRNLCLQNVLMTDEMVNGKLERVAKLADFGLSHSTTLYNSAYTYIPVNRGHQAPEVQSDSEFTFSSDIYSLGTILYFILTGKAFHPGWNNDMKAILRFKSHETFISWLVQCLDPKPSKRMTIADIYDEAKALLLKLVPVGSLTKKMSSRMWKIQPEVISSPNSPNIATLAQSRSNQKLIPKSSLSTIRVVRVQVRNFEEWLKFHQLEKYSKNFEDGHISTIEALTMITAEQLISIGITLPGQIKRILIKTAQLAEDTHSTWKLKFA